MSDTMKAVLWALLATWLFATVAAMAKLAVADYHVLQILFFRQIIVFLSALPPLLHALPHSLKTRHPGLHCLRLAGAFVALTCGIWAVAVLPLASAITLGFAKVFFVSLLAMKFLGEPVGRHRLGAVLAGFAGVVIVMRPGFDGLDGLNALIPVIGALGAGIAVTSVRRLAQYDSTATLLTYQAIVIGLMSGIPMFWLWKTPDSAGMLLMFGMGALAAMGQWAGIKALRLGEASVIGNMEYLKLIYAAGFGYLLFNEIPDRFTLLGAGVIMAAAGFIIHRETMIRSSRKS